MPFEFIYLSRNFNRSGYHVLAYLLAKKKYIPNAVILPTARVRNPLDYPATAADEKENYFQEAMQCGFLPVRFLDSIKLLCDRHDISVHSFETLKDAFAQRQLRRLQPDLIVIGGGWPELLPAEILAIPRCGAINTHPSLLPLFRGADVHRWQILHGVRESGVTIHYVDESFDTGDILGQVRVDVAPTDTPQDLANTTGMVAGPLMEDVLDRIARSASGRVAARTQLLASDQNFYHSKWNWDDREFLRIDWGRSAIDIHRLVLASTQESYRYNGPFFQIHGHEFLLRTSEVLTCTGEAQCGEIVAVDDHGVIVQCGDSGRALRMTRIQPSSLKDWYQYTHAEKAYNPRLLVDKEILHVHDRLQ